MSRPLSVSRALILLYATIAIGIVRSYFEFERISAQAEAQGGGKFVIFVQVFTFALMIAIFASIGWRQNWARWTLLIFMVLGAPFSIKPLIDSLSNEPVSGVLGLVQFVAQVVALIWLFQKPAQNWFKAPREIADPAAQSESGSGSGSGGVS